MKPYRQSSPFITIHAGPILKAIGAFIFVMFLLFSISGAITKLNHQLGLSSLNVHQAVSKLNTETLYALMGTENRYFLNGLPEEEHKISLTKPLIALATNIELDQPKSFLGRELPGLFQYERNVVAPRGGSDYTDMPMESSPPIKDIEKDPPVKDIEENEPPIDPVSPPPQKTTGNKDVVFIYFSHNRESFLPYLENVTNPDLAQHSEINVTKIGDRLKNELEERGIGIQMDKTDIVGKLLNQGKEYWQSYDASRPIVQEALASNRDLSYVIDIHRDYKGRDETTTKINGKTFAKLAFVVGRENPNYEKNLEIANELHKRLNEKYPGISRKVFEKMGEDTNGVFNQDLNGNALLIEFGGVENTFEELYNSAEAFADVFGEYYWQAEAVNAEEESSKTPQ